MPDFGGMTGKLVGKLTSLIVGDDEETPAAPGGSGPAVGDGMLLENGSDFLLLETGDFLLLE